MAKLRDADVPESTLQHALAGGLAVVPFDEALALAAGFLRPLTREFSLSLGDRACLALGQAREFPVLTADRGWLNVAAAVDVEVRVIRQLAS